MISNKTHLSNIDWIFTNDGSILIPVITEYDILKGKRTCDIGLGSFDKKIPAKDLERLTSENFLNKERLIIEVIARLKKCSPENLSFCSSEKMLFSIIDLPFDSKNPIIEAARNCEKDYTVALMSEYCLGNPEQLDSPPLRFRNDIVFKKHMFQKNFTDSIKLNAQQIKTLTIYIKQELQRIHKQQETSKSL